MSLVAVHCWDWPDLCKQENVSSYPTVHLYQPTAATPTPSNIPPTYTCKPLRGALDSRTLLEAVGINEETEEDKGRITMVRISIVIPTLQIAMVLLEVQSSTIETVDLLKVILES